MFASVMLLAILQPGTHGAERGEVAVCARSAARSSAPCGCQRKTALPSDLAPQWKLSFSAFSVIIPGTLEPEEVWGRRLLLSLVLHENSSSAYKYSNQKLHQRDTHFHSPVSFMIRDWIKGSTDLHTPCFSSFPFPGPKKKKKPYFQIFPICMYTERNTSYILKNVEIHFVSPKKSILLKGENNFYFSTISLHIACNDLLKF